MSQDLESLSFDEKAEQVIPADVRMISGCHDKQTSADVQNVTSFQLPDPAGCAGGACTSAILEGKCQTKIDSVFTMLFLNGSCILCRER